jgi:DNA polymerase-3 subunit beta
MPNKKESWEMNYEEFKVETTKQFEEGYGKPAKEAYAEFQKQYPGKASEVSIEVFLGIETDKHREIVHNAVKMGKPVPDAVLKLYPELMEITIDRKILLNALVNAKPMTSCKHTLAILSSVLIEAKNNAIEITATDLEMGFQGIYPAKVINPGSIAISNQELSNFISKSKADKISIKEKEKNYISLSDGSVSFDIFCIDADDFPILPEQIKTETPIEIDAFVLKNMIAKTVIPKPQNETDKLKLHITGSLFKIVKKGKQNFLCVVGHNGGILVKENREVSISGKINSLTTKDEVLIPKETLTKLNRSLLRTIKKPAKKIKGENKGFDFDLPSNDNVLLGVQGDFIVVKKQNETVIIRLLEGDFPDYHIAITRDEENKIPVIADRKFLLDAMKQISIIGDSDYQGATIKIETNKMEMHFVNPDKGEIEKNVPVKYKGELIEIKFVPKLFVNFLQLMESDIVKLDIIDPEQPCLLTGEQDEGIVFVIMPLKR